MRFHRALAGIRTLGGILKSAIIKWDADNIPRMGAALAYYTLFALAPLLVVAIGVAGLVFGADAARGQVVHEIDGLIGHNGAVAIQSLLVAARKPERSIPAALIGLITLFLGATSAFSALQGALNTIWNAKTAQGNVIQTYIRGRLLSFGMVLGIGFLLLVSLVLSAALAALGAFMHARLPGGAIFWEFINFIVSFGVTTLLFAMIFKVLPNVRLAWRDVWVGSLITSFFFTIGKLLIGLYLGTSTIGSSYGAAGSLVVIMLWVYYSSQVVLFGAEVTQAYVQRLGSKVVQPEVSSIQAAIERV
ncbi:MAG: YihY/virulence factor BrkB family protein [Gemmatimonadota bacterium]